MLRYVVSLILGMTATFALAAPASAGVRYTLRNNPNPVYSAPFSECIGYDFATRGDFERCMVARIPDKIPDLMTQYLVGGSYWYAVKESNGSCTTLPENTKIDGLSVYDPKYTMTVNGPDYYTGYKTVVTFRVVYVGHSKDSRPIWIDSCRRYETLVGDLQLDEVQVSGGDSGPSVKPKVNEDASCRKAKDSTFAVSVGTGGVFARLPLGKWIISCGVGDKSVTLRGGFSCSDSGSVPQCESKITACTPLAATEHSQAAARGAGLTAYVCQSRPGDRPADAEVAQPESPFSLTGVKNLLSDVGVLDARLHSPGQPIQTERNPDGSVKTDAQGRPIRYGFADMTVNQYCNVLKASDPSIYCGSDYAGVAYGGGGGGFNGGGATGSYSDPADPMIRVKVDYTNAPVTLNYTLNQYEFYCRDNPAACGSNATFNSSLSWSPTTNAASTISYNTNNTLVRYEQTGTKDGAPTYVITYVNNDNRTTTMPPQTGGGTPTGSNPPGTKAEEATFNEGYCDSLLEKIGARLGLSACIVEPDSVNIVEKTLQPVIGVDCGQQPDGAVIPCQNTSQVWTKKIHDNPGSASSRFMSQFSFPSDNPGDRSDFLLGTIEIPCFGFMTSCPNYEGKAGVWYWFDLAIPGWLLDILGVAIRLYGTYLMFVIIVG